MTDDRKNMRGPNFLKRPGLKLLNTPLAYIKAEHCCQRQLFRLCDKLAESKQFDSKLAKIVSDFLETDMAIHVFDEEKALFPKLRQRLNTCENADRVLGLLSGENDADIAHSKKIVNGLISAIKGNKMSMALKLRNSLLTFANRRRRHLMLENAIIMPLAERRLTNNDLNELTCLMKAKRSFKS